MTHIQLAQLKQEQGTGKVTDALAIHSQITNEIPLMAAAEKTSTSYSDTCSQARNCSNLRFCFYIHIVYLNTNFSKALLSNVMFQFDSIQAVLMC